MFSDCAFCLFVGLIFSEAECNVMYWPRNPSQRACGNRWGLWGGAVFWRLWLDLVFGRGCIPGLCNVQVPRVPHCRWDGMPRALKWGVSHPRVSKCVHAAFSPSVREETCTRETHFLLSGAQWRIRGVRIFYSFPPHPPTAISHAALI